MYVYLKVSAFLTWHDLYHMTGLDHTWMGAGGPDDRKWDGRWAGEITRWSIAGDMRSRWAGDQDVCTQENRNLSENRENKAWKVTGKHKTETYPGNFNQKNPYDQIPPDQTQQDSLWKSKDRYPLQRYEVPSLLTKVHRKLTKSKSTDKERERTKHN